MKPLGIPNDNSFPENLGVEFVALRGCSDPVIWPLAAIARVAFAAKVLRLVAKGAFGFFADFFKIGSKSCQHAGGDRAFDEWCSAAAHLCALGLIEKSERRFRAQYGASDIHQQEDALFAHHRADAVQDFRGIRAEFCRGLLRSPRQSRCGGPDRSWKARVLELP